ncbi:transcriptional antiterminator [Dolosicoccus paucivorans]|uniref:Transcriptional antiterminator n=1 Tax=Dolosicoccus paucivorans TaxID=84521 RepID=A0A2N6SPI2_9LACT|nr:PTS sugar transporter subunit IIA [Dolosicoccus paucivorans]PMC58970.1 transcriptional antiterminator [Dolosicoccus paucivorans]
MNSRQLKLLKLMIDERKYQSASYYADKMSVSTRTIYSDLNTINGFTKEYGGEIDRVPGLGVRIVGSIEKIRQAFETDRIIEQYKFEPINRRISIMKYLAFSKDIITLDFLSEKYFVSKTSIYNDFNILNKIILNSGAYIDSSETGIYLCGKEDSVQKAIKSIILYFSNDKSELSFDNVLLILFSRETVNHLNNIIKNEFEAFPQNASIYYYRSLVSALLIQLERLKLGFKLSNNQNEQGRDIQYKEIYPLAERIANKISGRFLIDYSESDKIYITKQLYAHRVYKEEQNIHNNIGFIVKRLIEDVGQAEAVDLTYDEHLYHSLVQHFQPMLLRLEKGIQIENPLLNSIKNRYMELFSILWYFLSDFEREFRVSLNDHEISLILIHFQIALEKNLSKNKIIIVCQYGTTSAQLIYQQVKRILPDQDDISILTANEVQNSKENEVNLIISTIDLPDINHEYVKVSPIFTQKDYNNILNAYTTYLFSVGEGSEGTTNILAPTTQGYMMPELIELQVDVDTKEEALDLLISQLEKQKLVTKEFRKSIFKREQMGSTNLENRIALPHADPITVIESSISFATLSKPISWGRGKVQLIIMISLNKEDSENIKRIIEELVPLIDNKQLVDELILEENKDNWITYFNQ